VWLLLGHRLAHKESQFFGGGTTADPLVARAGSTEQTNPPELDFETFQRLLATQASEPSHLTTAVAEYLFHKHQQCPVRDPAKRMRTVIQEVLADFMVEILSQEVQLLVNLRVLFKAVDTATYGHISTLQFSELLHHVWWAKTKDEDGMPAVEVEYMLDFIGFENGNVGYQRLHERLYSTSHQMQRREEELAGRSHSIRAVTVVTRHGARFPTKAFPRSMHWPKSKVSNLAVEMPRRLAVS
jgi:hypothetical protein